MRSEAPLIINLNIDVFVRSLIHYAERKEFSGAPPETSDCNRSVVGVVRCNDLFERSGGGRTAHPLRSRFDLLLDINGFCFIIHRVTRRFIRPTQGWPVNLSNAANFFLAPARSP